MADTIKGTYFPDGSTTPLSYVCYTSIGLTTDGAERRRLTVGREYTIPLAEDFIAKNLALHRIHTSLTYPDARIREELLAEER